MGFCRFHSESHSDIAIGGYHWHKYDRCALPVNNTSAEIAAVVASKLNEAFSDNKIYRTASNVAGSSGVTLTFRDSDGVALNTIMASDTTGAFDDFTAANTITTGNIYVGGVTVSITPGLTAHNVASAVQSALQANFATSSATESRVVVNEGSGTITITYPDESPSVSLISYSADSLVGISTTREVNQVVDTQAVFENNGKFLKAGELTIGAAPEPTLQRTITFGPAMTASTQNLTFGAWSAGTNNSFSITTKGGSSQDVVVTSINLGTVEQTLQFTAPTAASADTITVSLTDHNSTTFSVAIASTFNSADSARTVACEFVNNANALFAAQGVSYNAFETSAGEVKVIFGSSPSMTLSTFTAAITTGTFASSAISLTAASALPQNRTTADISSIVADQLNASFSANGVMRQATDLGDGVVKLVWASTDNIPLTPSITSVTTGINFTASQTTLTGGTITVGGVSVELSTTAGLTASNIAAQVKARSFCRRQLQYRIREESVR